MSEDKSEATLDEAAEVVTESTDESAKSAPVKTKSTPTMDGPVPAVQPLQAEGDDNPNAVVNRFRPSGLTHAKYDETRVRRIEPWQLSSYRNSLRNLGVKNLEGMDAIASDPKKVKVAAKLLGACLVRPYRPSGAAQLFRKGAAGVQQILKDLPPNEIVSALKVACELSNVFA
jgi:hypothetical protein